MNSSTANENVSATRWSGAQAYGLAVVTLLLGLAVGYLVHGPGAVTKDAAGQSSSEGSPHAGMSVTPEQMKHMADVKAEPVLAKLKQNPNDADLLAEAGNIYMAGHQFNTAIEFYDKSAAAKADANVLTQLSNAYFYAGSPDKAIETLNRALEVDPKFANALFNLGALKWQVKGDNAGAVAAWQKLLKTNPNHPRRQEVEQMIARVKQSKKPSAPMS